MISVEIIKLDVLYEREFSQEYKTNNPKCHKLIFICVCVFFSPRFLQFGEFPITENSFAHSFFLSSRLPYIIAM